MKAGPMELGVPVEKSSTLPAPSSGDDNRSKMVTLEGSHASGSTCNLKHAKRPLSVEGEQVKPVIGKEGIAHTIKEKLTEMPMTSTAVPRKLRRVVGSSIPDDSLNYLYHFFLAVVNDDVQRFLKDNSAIDISQSDYETLQQFLKKHVPIGIRQRDHDQLLAEKVALEAREFALHEELQQFRQQADMGVVCLALCLADVTEKFRLAEEQAHLKDIEIARLKQEAKRLEGAQAAAQNEIHKLAHLKDIEIARLKREAEHLEGTLAAAQKEICEQEAQLKTAKDFLGLDMTPGMTQVESIFELLPRLKTMTDESMKRVALKNLRARLQDQRYWYHFAMKLDKQFKEKWLKIETLFDQFSYFARGEGRQTPVAERGELLKTLFTGSQNELENHELTRDLAIIIGLYKMRFQEDKQILQILELRSDELHDFRDESYNPILEEFRALKTILKARLFEYSEHLERFTKMDERQTELRNWGRGINWESGRLPEGEESSGRDAEGISSGSDALKSGP